MQKRISIYFVSLLMCTLLSACKPSADPQQISTYTNESVDILLTGSDRDGDPLTFAVTTPPIHGQLAGNPPNITYTPNPGFEGDDQFGFVANDGQDDSSEAFVVISVVGGSANDLDGDGVANVDDAFPNNPGEIADTDADGVGNFADRDEDNDGVVDTEDSYPFDENRQSYDVVSELEFNDNPTDATPVNYHIPFRLAGTIQAAIDGDYYQFSAEPGQSITALLRKTADSFSPSLSLLDANGDALSAAELNLAPYSNNLTAISLTVPESGTYYLSVTDFESNGDPTFSYTVDVFIDEDLDGLDDSVALALGINLLKDDSDNDGIIDGVETPLFGAVPSDVDGDTIPNWLDKDADGDTIADQIEKALDSDGDQVPNFLDTDSDDNGIPDSEEKGPNNTPLDSDADGIYDFLDADDDNDGLGDIIDDDRLVAVTTNDELDPSQRLLLNHLEYRVGDYFIEGVAPVGSQVTIYGEGFAGDSNANTVVLRNGDKLLNITPDSATKGELTVTLPGEVIDELFVVANNKRSNTLSVEIQHSHEPILFQGDALAVMAGELLSLHGQNFSDPMTVSFGGVALDATDITETQANVLVPNNITAGNLSVTTSRGTSNSINVDVLKPHTINVVLPSNATVDFAELSAGASQFDQVTIDANGQAVAQVSDTSIDFISITRTDTAGKFLYLQAPTLPGFNNTEISPVSTALAMMIIASPNLKKADIDQLNSHWAALEQLPETVALASILNVELVNDPRFLLSPNNAYLQALSAAVVAAEELVTPNTGNNRVGIAAEELSGPEITPEQHGIEVYPLTAGTFNDALTGDIGVRNDTKLFLSTRILDKETNEVLYDHIDSYFDKNIVPAQNLGILFNAGEKEDYQQCNFIDCTIEIVSPGINSLSDNDDVAAILATKTIIEQVIHPIFELALDRNIKPSDVTKILVNAAPNMVNAVGVEVTSGDTTAAFSILVNHIMDDFMTPPTGGPITQALARQLGLDLSDALRDQLLERIAAKAVPVLGQIDAAIDAFGVFSTAWGVEETARDLVMPGDLAFEVVWPMEVVDILPKVVSSDQGPQLLILKGQGLGKVENVRLVDEGVGGQPPLVLQPGARSEDHRGLSVLLTSDYIAGAVGPIAISITSPDDYDESPVKLEIINELTITELIPDSGVPGDIVEIIGAGFSPVRTYNRVTFQGDNGRIAATVVSAEPNQLTVRVPAGAVTGDVTVQVEDEVSNGVQFEIEAGNVYIDFGDNGPANDDTFGLYVDSILIHAMPQPTRHAGPFSIQLTPGTHYVTLRGITAPDDIGTYFISFGGSVSDVSGDALSEEDLTAGVEKHWTIEVSSQPAPSAMPQFSPSVEWLE